MIFLNFLIQNISLIAAGFLLTLMSSFGQTFFISVFSGEIRADFGLTHGEWGTAYAVGTFSSAVVMVWSGGLSDRFKTRQLGIGVFCGLAVAALCMAMNPYAVLLPVVIFLLRLMGQGMSSHLAAVAMSRWFVAQRGRALSLSNLGFSLGEASLPILFVVLLGVYDWRVLWGLSALVICAAIPVLWTLLSQERTPQSMAQQNEATGMQGRHWTRQQSLGHPLFWFMIPTLMGPGAFVTAFFFQQVPFAQGLAVDHLALVAVFPIYSAVSVGANILSGIALDRYGAARLMPLYLVPMAAAFFVFAQAQTLLGVGIGLVFLALSAGANGTLPVAFWAEFYGTRHLGGIKAIASAVMVVGSAVGPAITGWFLTLGVPLGQQYSFVGLYFCGATVAMMIGIRKYNPSRQ